MDAQMNLWMQAILRWIHVVAGIAWVGQLYFFNWVNAHFAKTLDGPTKKAVVPELMPRALYWFRWGAAWTFVSGVLLAGLVYYMGGALFEHPETGDGMTATLILLGALVAVFLYDVLMRVLATRQLVANALALLMLAIVYVVMERVGHFGGRALYIHVGSLFGTVMAMNVWMRIWPAQKKIITAIKEGSAPDAALVAMAGMRSRHNTFMSVPLVFLMVSNHYPLIFGDPLHTLYLAGVIVVGFATVAWLYKKSATVKGF